jgi:hypothetical protein
MSIKYPVTFEGESPFVFIYDASVRSIAGGLTREDAEEIVNALNSQPKRKSKKIQIEEALKRSDLTAREVGRDDIEYGHHDQLPRGEHVARLRND